MTENYCSDDELEYASQATRFEVGKALVLDASYRLAHLPIVAPGHPRVIATKAGTSYELGKHEVVTSLVLPVPSSLFEAPAYKALEADLRSLPFVSKIAWDIFNKRRHRLHATLCGPVAEGSPLRKLDAEMRTYLSRLGPLSLELRGIFSGTVNHGRLYLKTYPRRCAGENSIASIQRMLGANVTGLYLVGLFNLMDDLTVQETDSLRKLIDRWWNKTILTFSVEQLWLLSARDDLVLDAEITDWVSLV